ncbi:MAG: hypothetical protein WBM34_12220 [Woeseiaceae bacterium]
MSTAESKDGSIGTARLEVDAGRFIGVLIFVLIAVEVFLCWRTRLLTWES